MIPLSSVSAYFLRILGTFDCRIGNTFLRLTCNEYRVNKQLLEQRLLPEQQHYACATLAITSCTISAIPLRRLPNVVVYYVFTYGIWCSCSAYIGLMSTKSLGNLFWP